MKKPFNYRETPILLANGCLVMVAALAKPNYFGQNTEETFSYLKKNNISVIFGLESEASFLKDASNLQLEYIDCSIPDFTAPSIELFDQIYETAIHQSNIGKKIAIHCHGGMGRTGTVLAALKLREMAMLDSFYEKDTLETLNSALTLLRQLPGNAYVVEVKEQEDRLCEYIEKLKLREKSNHSINLRDFRP